jgi:hypothetical protein
MRRKTRKKSIVLALLAGTAALTLSWTYALWAHEIPADAVVRAYLQVDDDDLTLLARVPLESMRDVRFPLRGPGFLDLASADQALQDAAVIWIANQIEIYEGERRLEHYALRAARVALPSDRSFSSYTAALASITGPALPATTELMWNQALLDVMLVYPIETPDADFSVRPRFERLGMRTTTVLRFIANNGVERPYEFVGDPGLLRLDPRWHHAFFRFIVLGFEHILDGFDHLLFILCLIIPLRQFRPLVVIVTSFTLAHSITLLSSAFGFVPTVSWFPPLIETLIAASIVYVALENIIAGELRRRWMIAFAFGLVHGFGFAFALSETLQFAGSHLVTSLLAFNLGVEFGQLFVIALVVPVVNLLFRYVMPERLGVIILSALLAHSGWHWMSERAGILASYSFQWPDLDTAPLVLAFRWLMFLLVVAAAMWLMKRWNRRMGVRGRRP